MLGDITLSEKMRPHKIVLSATAGTAAVAPIHNPYHRYATLNHLRIMLRPAMIAAADEYDGGWTDQLDDDDDADDDETPDWLAETPPTASAPEPIETLKVGRVSGPFRRRNGYHVEVRVQHPSAEATTHRLWVAHETINEVGALRGTDEDDERLEISKFAVAVMDNLQKKGVNLADPNWALDDESVPFTSDFVPVRTLYNYYEEIREELALALMGPIAPGNEPWDGTPPQAPGAHPLAIYTSNPDAPVSDAR